MLHDALAPEGIHVAQLIIPLGIGGGHPAHEPAALSETLWRVYSEGKDFRTFVTPLSEFHETHPEGWATSLEGWERTMNMVSYDFNGNVAFVTGGSAAMGAATARAFAEAGAAVGIADLDGGAADRVSR